MYRHNLLSLVIVNNDLSEATFHVSCIAATCRIPPEDYPHLHCRGSEIKMVGESCPDAVVREKINRNVSMDAMGERTAQGLRESDRTLLP